MSCDISACVGDDIGPVLIKLDPQIVFRFPDVLGVAASSSIEKVYNVGGIASHHVSDCCEHFACSCSLTSESSCFH